MVRMVRSLADRTFQLCKIPSVPCSSCARRTLRAVAPIRFARISRCSRLLTQALVIELDPFSRLETDLKLIVSELGNGARAPRLMRHAVKLDRFVLSPRDLCLLALNPVSLLSQGHPNVWFEVDLDGSCPGIHLNYLRVDPRTMCRAIIL